MAQKGYFPSWLAQTSDKTQLIVDTLKVMAKVNYDETYVEFLFIFLCFWQRKAFLRKFTALKNRTSLTFLNLKVMMRSNSFRMHTVLVLRFHCI